jgi:hypothetical protein
MNKFLHFTAFLEMIIGSSGMNIYTSPEQFAYWTVFIPVMVGLWKMVFAECAEAPLLVYKPVATGTA